MMLLNLFFTYFHLYQLVKAYISCQKFMSGFLMMHPLLRCNIPSITMIMRIDQTVIKWRKDPVLGIRPWRRGDYRELFAYTCPVSNLSPHQSDLYVRIISSVK